MRDVNDGVGRKRQREDGQRLSWIADERRRRNQKESNRDGDVRSRARANFVRDGEADVRTANQRKEQRGDLRESQLRDEPFRRRDWNKRRPDRLPREASGESKKRNERRAERFGQSRKYRTGERENGKSHRHEVQRIDPILRRIEGSDDGRGCSAL